MLGPQPFCLVDFVSFEHPKPNLPYITTQTTKLQESLQEKKKQHKSLSTRGKTHDLLIDSQKFGHIQHTNKQMFDDQNQMFLGLGSKTLGLGLDPKKSF
jgi:hypothetical protein